jgi:pimeloyl-ACP methyl ester carboxylesterase
MSIASVNGIEIFYETTGSPSGTPLLLLSGLGMQLTGWPPEWRDGLAVADHYVICHDNRDVGLSSHFPDVGTPDLGAIFEGSDPNVTYLLADMADDAAGLLDHLGVERAHVVGISMGGMIAQELAIRHPERLLSLCSMMSTTGDPGVGQPSPAAVAALIASSPLTREESMESAVAMSAIIGSPAYPSDPEVDRERAGAAFDRCSDPDGVARHLGAVLMSPDRTLGLGAVTVPTLVIHGDSDPLVNPSGGEATAKAIPGAELLIVEGMGHDLPVQLNRRLIGAVVAHAASVDTAGLFG